jgi:hypothetical protein
MCCYSAPDNVTASEVGTYAFCSKAWHLEHVVGRRPSDVAQELRRSGIAAHAAHGSEIRKAQRVGDWMSRVIVGLLAISLVLLMLGILLSER